MARHGISTGIVAVAVFCGLGHPKSQVHNRPLTEVRFESVRGGMPFFAATVNASGPLEFLLDTGGSGEHVDREIANRLGLKLERARASVSGRLISTSVSFHTPPSRSAALDMKARWSRRHWLPSNRFWAGGSKGSSAVPFSGATCSGSITTPASYASMSLRSSTTTAVATRCPCRSPREFRSSPSTSLSRTANP